MYNNPFLANNNNNHNNYSVSNNSNSNNDNSNSNSNNANSYINNRTTLNKQQKILNQKKNSFRCQIRNKQLKDIKKRIRKVMQFRNEENYNQLKNINLHDDLKIVLSFWKEQTQQMQGQRQTQMQMMRSNQRQLQLIENNKNCCKWRQSSFQQNGQLSKLVKSIQNIFMYAVSSQLDHLCELMLTCHLQSLLYILDIVQKLKNESKCFALFHKILWILSNYTSYDPSNMPKIYIQHLYRFLYQQRHSKQIIQLCLNSFSNMLTDQKIRVFLVQNHKQNTQNDSIFDRILKIMNMVIEQIQIKKVQSQKQKLKQFQTTSILLLQLLDKVFNFYRKLFETVSIRQFSSQYKAYFFQKIEFILKNYSQSLYTMDGLTKTLSEIYSKSLDDLFQLINETSNIISLLSMFIQAKCKSFKKKVQTKKNNHLMQVLIQAMFAMFYIYTPSSNFNNNNSNKNDGEQQYQKQKNQKEKQQDQQKEKKRLKALDILDDNLSQSLLTGLYYGLCCGHENLNNWCLRLLVNICDQYEYADLIMEDLRILNHIFHHSYHSSYSLKKSATLCLCKLAQSLFLGQSSSKGTQIQMDIQYEILSENKLIQILVLNLDEFVDQQLNQQILQTVDVLCDFYGQGQSNKIWNKFWQEGGKAKLQFITHNERPKHVQQKAAYLLDKFGLKQLDFD